MPTHTHHNSKPTGAEALAAARNGQLLDPYDHLSYAITTAGILFDCLSFLQDTAVAPAHLVRVASLGSQWCQKAEGEAKRLYEAGKEWQERAEQQEQQLEAIRQVIERPSPKP